MDNYDYARFLVSLYNQGNLNAEDVDWPRLIKILEQYMNLRRNEK